MPPRHHAFRPEQRPQVLESLRKGSTFREAAGSAGIPWSTWMGWCRSVREGTCADPDVAALVREAQVEYDAASVGLRDNVTKAAAKDWRAAAWQLEHRQGDPKARHDAKRARYEAEIAKHRAEGTHVERVAVTEMTDAELREEARRLLGEEGLAGASSRETH